MSYGVPRRQLKKAKDYRKTAMRVYLTQPVLGGLRENIELPPLVTEARNMLLMYIDHHIEFQTGKPQHTLDNLVQSALTFRSITGRKLNLTMDQDDDEYEEPEPMDVEEKPKKKKVVAKEAKKPKVMVPDDDDEVRNVMLQARKALLKQREIDALHERLQALEAGEDDDEEA
jgi:hypothetical protein